MNQVENHCQAHDMEPVLVDHGDEAPGVRNKPEGAVTNRFAFVASTGRTATMHLAQCLNRLPNVTGLFEGHLVGDELTPLLPLMTVHNRKAWQDPAYANRLVADKRGAAILNAAAQGTSLLVDVAYYNQSLLEAIGRQHPDALLFAMFRRCEGFVRSATIVSGEDPMPAGWPDRSKSLTSQEKFISIGRLRPWRGHPDSAAWPEWSAIQRNIWLWATVNARLHRFAQTNPNCDMLFLEDLADRPEVFWTAFLTKLGNFSDSALSECIESSKTATNAREAYEVGPAENWSRAEKDFLAARAQPLESRIYG